MSQSLYAIAPSLIINTPVCPTCRTAMMIVRIEPEKPDHDRRTYECPQCDHSESRVVKFK